MNNLIVKNVPFCGVELLAVQIKETGKIYVGINPILRDLGFDDKQIEYRRDRWVSDKTLKKGTQKFSGTFLGSKTGKDIWCMDIKKLPLALAKLDITPKMEKEMPELSERLEEYQDKCADVLAEAFLPTKFTNQELSPQLQLLINMELKQKEQDQKLTELDEKVNSIKEVVALNPNDWRKDSGKIINKIALSLGGYEHIKAIREESYKLLEQRMGVALSIRLTNKKKTMSLNGVCKSKIDKLNQLDVIADDKKLIEGYIAIIKDMAIKYEVTSAEVA